MFSTEPVSFYVATRRVWVFHFLYILVNTCYFLFKKVIAFLVGLKWHLIVVLICISLTTNGIEHIFICLLAICISSLAQCLFKSFTWFSVGLFVFLLLSCKSSFCILDTTLLLNIWFARISLWCAFLLSSWYFFAEENILKFWYSPIYSFFVACAFCVISRKPLLNQVLYAFDPHNWPKKLKPIHSTEIFMATYYVPGSTVNTGESDEQDGGDRDC